VLPVELLNGLTYALACSAAASYAADLAPVGAEGTLQGIVGTALLGIGMQFIILNNKIFWHHRSGQVFDQLLANDIPMNFFYLFYRLLFTNYYVN